MDRAAYLKRMPILASLDPDMLSVVNRQPRSATAVAAETTQALAIHRDHLLELLRHLAEPAVQNTLLLCLRVRCATELLAGMRFLPLSARIAKRLCEHAGILREGSVRAMDIPTRQVELAELVGASREAVNKQLARLREMGLIQTGRGSVRICRPEQLRDLASGNVTEITL